MCALVALSFLAVGGLIYVCRELVQVIKAKPHRDEESRVCIYPSTAAVNSGQSPVSLNVFASENIAEAGLDGAEDLCEAGSVFDDSKGKNEASGGIECGNCHAEITGIPCEVKVTDEGKFKVYRCSTCESFVQLPIG